MTVMHSVKPSLRVRTIHDVPPAPEGQYVLYWMIGARRHSWNLALDRAVDWARTLGKPLLVLEALRCDYRWASDRLHGFVMDGMRDNQQAFEAMGIGYYPYVERARNEGRGLLRSLAAGAAVVVTDRAPVFELPGLVSAASSLVPVRFEEVDSNGILPLDSPPTEAVYPTAYAFRRYLQHRLPEHLGMRPRSTPVVAGDLAPPPMVPVDVLQRWPPADRQWLDNPAALSALPIDHTVAPTALRGGPSAAREHLATFIDQHVGGYAEDRNHPDNDVGSGLSPYLHFGHVSAHEVVARVLRHEGWKPAHLATTTSGAKDGWWGVSHSAEAFLDQIVTWRELGFNMSARRRDYDQFESLPPWAQSTLDTHARDPRPHVYALGEFAAAATHDPLWNAAQRQLVTEGRIHNYLRMLWGKKILEWTPSPREALAVMIELNNRFALDGRDPNSYSGIFWVLGRYDRPWPERPIFGTIRYMTSASTERKLHVKAYLRRYAPPSLF
jgi:deoxyribodipyrimidine photo-lyase